MRVSAGAVNLAIEVAGIGAPLLFVHGFPVDRTMWRHQLDEIDGWTCLAPDLRGAGQSDVPAGAEAYSMRRYAEDMVAVLDALGLGPVVCCGLSMGGYILFELLRRHPDRVRGLILCDTKSEADPVEGRQARDALARVATSDGMPAVAERLLPKLLGRSSRAANPQVVEEVRAMVLRSPVGGVVGALKAMRDRCDSTALLASVSVPTLVLGGAEDELTPPGVMRAMAERIPGARYLEIGEAGHMAPLERPEAVNAALTAFLRTLA